jgi:hypothetical protein|tara:strand:+ start:13 stop:186 length:174 start_codon:yes stop_codon:yes gene_type:complete
MRKIRVKVMLSLEIDPEDYPIPSDGYVIEEIEESLEQHFHELDGVEVLSLKVLQRGE